MDFLKSRHATPPKYPLDIKVKSIDTIEWDNSKEFKTLFNIWTFPNKQSDFKHVELSCDSGICAPGDILASEIDVICKMVQLYYLNEIKLTQSQTMLPHMFIL